MLLSLEQLSQRTQADEQALQCAWAEEHRARILMKHIRSPCKQSKCQ
jgi:hypothetical protein